MSTTEQQAAKMLEAIRGFVARKVDPINSRLSTVEVRTAALSMLLIGKSTPQRVDELESLIHRVRDLEEIVKNLQQGQS